MVHDIYYKVHCIRIASRVVEQVLQEKSRKIGGGRAQHLVSLPEIKLSLDTRGQKLRKNRYQTFVILSSFA